MQWHNFLGTRFLGPWGGAKRSNIIKSQLQSQLQRFLKPKAGFLFRHPGHALEFRTWGAGGGGSKFNFLNMVMWHIKLKEMSSRPGYTELFYPRIKLVTMGWVQMIKYH